jgi:DNA-binding HxlR family transcriptional regulator
VIGDRWSLVIIQELRKRSNRYSDLLRRLPGISPTVLVERLRKLETAGVVERRVGGVGEGVEYGVTERGLALDEAFGALRRWGVEYLFDPTADGSERRTYDVHYVEGIDGLDDTEFGLTVDRIPTTLHFTDGQLEQMPGAPTGPGLIVTTTAAFMDRWASGEASWDDGVSSGEVVLSGTTEAWPQWLAATGYVLRYDTEMTNV